MPFCGLLDEGRGISYFILRLRKQKPRKCSALPWSQRDSLVDSEPNPGILLQVQKEPGQLVYGSESQSQENKGRNLQLVNELLDFCLAALKIQVMDFPGGPVVKNLPDDAGDMGLIPGLGRFHMLLSN